jgi:hypothetical protein
MFATTLNSTRDNTTLSCGAVVFKAFGWVPTLEVRSDWAIGGKNYILPRKGVPVVVPAGCWITIQGEGGHRDHRVDFPHGGTVLRMRSGDIYTTALVAMACAG